MEIREAVRQAVREGKAMYRSSCLHGEKDRKIFIKTDGKRNELLVCENGKNIRKETMWAPTADDLMANDWEVLRV